MRIAALIPCRGGSKRVPGKNGRELGRLPLYWWSMETAALLGVPCYISTEVEEWGKEAEGLKAKWIKRPEELAGDDTTDYDVVRHVLGETEGIDLLLYLRPTTPFRDPAVIRRAIEIMESGPYTSLRSVELMVESAFKCFTMRPDYCLEAIKCEGGDVTDLPNQNVVATYKANGYVDIIRPARSQIHRNMWGAEKYGFLTPRTVEIDTEEDLEYARWYYERKWRSN